MYPEVSALVLTPEQELGIAIAHKLLLNALKTEQHPPAPPLTPGAFFAREVLAKAEAFRVEHVGGPKGAIVRDGFDRSDAAKQTQAAALLGVDIVIKIPPDAPDPPPPQPPDVETEES